MVEFINPNLRGDIQLKLDKIAGDPKAYDARKELVVQDLRSIGDVYSFWIENPDLRRAFLLENAKERTLKKRAGEGIRAVHNGWYFLSKKGEHGKFIQVFDERILQKLNGLVEPKIYGAGSFRKKDVTLNVKGYTPPSWERVPEKVRELLAQIKEDYSKDPLEAAILAHLGIAAIQPFIEGNKRCARLVQDRILFDLGMPPAIITAGEGKFYFDLLSRTLPAYKGRNIKEQRQFYDYCASKVNNGLDEILGDLEISERENCPDNPVEERRTADRKHERLSLG